MIWGTKLKMWVQILPVLIIESLNAYADDILLLSETPVGLHGSLVYLNAFSKNWDLTKLSENKNIDISSGKTLAQSKVHFWN